MEKRISSSVEETFQIAGNLAKTAQKGDIYCLIGELGAGKTHFVKGFVEQLGVDKNIVSSPTFTIINEYEGKLPIYHFDCYRLDSSQEALEIGAEEYFYGDGVCLIEWPQKIVDLIPAYSKRIEINSINSDTREIIIHDEA